MTGQKCRSGSDPGILFFVPGSFRIRILSGSDPDPDSSSLSPSLPPSHSHCASLSLSLARSLSHTHSPLSLSLPLPVVRGSMCFLLSPSLSGSFTPFLPPPSLPSLHHSTNHTSFSPSESTVEAVSVVSSPPPPPLPPPPLLRPAGPVWSSGHPSGCGQLDRRWGWQWQPLPPQSAVCDSNSLGKNLRWWILLADPPSECVRPACQCQGVCVAS